jgi:type IV pilus assembly protein PilB
MTPDFRVGWEGFPEAQSVVDEAASDALVLRTVDALLMDALSEEASDIHIEPGELAARVRYRLDGVLHEVQPLTVDLHLRVVSRLKILARLDIAERRVPQDGHFKYQYRDGHVDLRLSTLPTLHGEKAVLRILDSAAALRRELEDLGYEPTQMTIVQEAIARPYGMILVTGPTGSGKTLSLYACLRRLNGQGANICTVEDPVEIQLAGVNQVNVHERAGLDFATALRAFLRQDPDIMMVGEVRDAETADIAVKAAQTGHLVLSTLHTNDAPATLERLVRMGVAGYNLASSVLLVTAQRLVRRLCVHCREPLPEAQESLRYAGLLDTDKDADRGAVVTAFTATGCPQCRGTGYRGRTGIFQVMPISTAIRDLIVAGATTTEIAAQSAREGHLNLRQAGLLKVARGETSLAEVMAVTND